MNDTYGHAAGDVVLQAFADICVGTVRSTDLVGRHGGEEFVLLLPGADSNRAEAMVGQLSARFALANFAEGFDPPTVSYGIAAIDATSTDLGTVIGTADAALYEAKSLGRNRAVKGASGLRS